MLRKIVWNFTVGLILLIITVNPHEKAYSRTINQNRFHRLHKQSQQSKEILRILRSKTAIGTVIFNLEIWQIS